MRKLELVGILAGNIAHDFNNLLSHITGDAEKLAERVQHHSYLGNMAEGIKKTSFKAAELAQRLITFSEGGGAVHREVPLASVLNSTITAYPLMQKWIREISTPPHLNPLYGNEEELGQVFNNLLQNAQEAKINGKDIEVTITAENTSLPAGNNTALKPGKYIKVYVSDNGKGIPVEQIDKVFDPYFSTKDTFHQKGMGLGLAICYSIVKKHNGHITIKSEPGKGTAVELLLPAYAENYHGAASMPLPSG
jgi:signal transduction histidine kinase